MSPDAIYASSLEGAEEAARGLRSVGLFQLRGLPDLTADASERLDAIEIDDLESFLAENNVEVLDVREKSERDEGFIEGTRHLPYRIVRKCLDDLPRGQANHHDLLQRRPSLDRSERDRGRRQGSSSSTRRWRRGLGRPRRQHGAVPPLWQLSSERSLPPDTPPRLPRDAGTSPAFR